MTNKLDEKKMIDLTPEWATARCIYCGRKFEYMVNTFYKPKTCNSYDYVESCIYNFSSNRVENIQSNRYF